MTEKLAQHVGRLRKGQKFDFYIGMYQRKAKIAEKTSEGDLVLNMIDGGNPGWKTSKESLGRSPVHRTLEEGPRRLSYKGK